MTKAFWVRQALKGWRKEHRTADNRRPFSWGLLGGIFSVLPLVCESGFEVSLFRAAFSLAFFGALRVGELVSPSKRVPGGLGFDDTVTSDEGVVIRIRRSKTDQRGRGVSMFLGRLRQCDSCPVATIEEFLGRFQFLAVFRKCLGEMGLASSEYGTHSFRIGAATEAARLGLPDDIIKKLGRWESALFRWYIQPDRIDRLYR
ncbi:uncharacterized protein PAF06_017531 [Gastrophryne carolinensis]